MNRALIRQMDRIRAALLAGDAPTALEAIDGFARTAARKGIDAPTRDALEPALADLRGLAEASMRGAQQAAEQVRAIVQAARSLQTYDSLGRRTVSETRANAPQRF